MRLTVNDRTIEIETVTPSVTPLALHRAVTNAAELRMGAATLEIVGLEYDDTGEPLADDEIANIPTAIVINVYKLTPVADLLPISVLARLTRPSHTGDPRR